MVQTQICELEETLRHTEVREGTEVDTAGGWERQGPISWWRAQEVWGPCMSGF